MFTLNCKGRLLVVDKPIVMGILNATPDSFFKNSRFSTTDSILQKAEMMMKDGAVILDIGGQSTRPNSEEVGYDDELKRVIPAIEAVKSRFPDVFISIDTYYAKVAAAAVSAGADIVNDISACTIDPKMIETISTLQVPYVLMHMKGTPQTMQQLAVYDDVALEVLDFFIKKVSLLQAAGINDIILDPGFGFAKTIAHNFELLKKLEVFSSLDKPVLAGLSRKSFISKTLGITTENALNGTSVLNTISLLNGASILRVHDVKEAVEAIQLVSTMSR